MAGPTTSETARALNAFAEDLEKLGWVRALWVCGSWASGDHVPGVSDLDLVALADGPVDEVREPALLRVHRRQPRQLKLGCAYVDAGTLAEVTLRHPTYTHGLLIERPLSPMVRVALVQEGQALSGPPPTEVLPPAGPADVRRAIWAELDGYWRRTLRRRWLWLDLRHKDLAVTTAARAELAMKRGALVSKQAGLASSRQVPTWLLERSRRVRAGESRRTGRHRIRGAVASWRAMASLVRGAGFSTR